MLPERREKRGMDRSPAVAVPTAAPKPALFYSCFRASGFFFLESEAQVLQEELVHAGPQGVQTQSGSSVPGRSGLPDPPQVREGAGSPVAGALRLPAGIGSILLPAAAAAAACCISLSLHLLSCYLQGFFFLFFFPSGKCFYRRLLGEPDASRTRWENLPSISSRFLRRPPEGRSSRSH